MRAVHLTHAAGAEQRLQVIAAKRPFSHVLERNARDDVRDGQRRPSKELVVGHQVIEQDFDFAAERSVFGTGLGEKRRALAGRLRVCGVIERFDPLPAFRRHPAAPRPSRSAATPSRAASRA